MKKAYTLAEVMITLTVIGIITAVILPVAMHSKPDENVMKFKKANSALYQAITTLINDEKYFQNGDLGYKSNGQSADFKYFCNALSDILTVKSTDCTNENTYFGGYGRIGKASSFDSTTKTCLCKEDSTNNLNSFKKSLDIQCEAGASGEQSTAHEQIKTTDGVIYFAANPATYFKYSSITHCMGSQVEEFSKAGKIPASWHDEGGFDVTYFIFCVDIDGFKKGEDPFGYGLRSDGKLLTGARADEWLNKSIQGEN